MPSFVYEAKDRSGRPQTGRIEAETLPAARQRLQQQGLNAVRLHTDVPATARARTQGLGAGNDTSPVQQALRPRSSGFAAALLRAYLVNALLWLPLCAWAGWSLYVGPPFGVGAWVSFVFATLSLLLPIWAAMPVVLYDRLLQARSWNRWDEVLALARHIENIGRWLPQQPAVIDATFARAAALAAHGDITEAMVIASGFSTQIQPRHVYLSRLNPIYTAAHAWNDLAKNQASAVSQSHRGTHEIIDYAITLAWRLNQPSEAAVLLDEVRKNAMSALTRGYFDFADGLVALARNRHGQADTLLSQAVATLGGASRLPTMDAQIDFIQAHRVLCLAALGRKPEAARLLRTVLPRLKAFGELELVRRCAAATVGG